MAYNYYQKDISIDTEEDSKSQFNEAFLKMYRINKLQDAINNSNISPLAWNVNLNVYNYQILFSSLNGLLMEAWSKLNPKEKEDAGNMKSAIESAMKKYPIYETRKNVAIGKTETKLNKRNWETISKWLFKYEVMVREMLGRTGYDSPNKEEYPEDEL